MFDELASLTLSVKSDSVKKASDRLDNLENEAVRAQRGADNLGGGFSKSGKKLAAFSAAAVSAYIALRTLREAAAFAVQTSRDFEETLSSVEAVTQSSASQMADMARAARSLGATTRFSASEAAEGMKFLGMAGFETSEIISAMPGLLSLATAGALELGEAADIASNVLSGFNMRADESARVADVLAAAASSSNTSVIQLGEGMKFVAPVAASLGISIEDTAAAMGVLSDAGLQSTMAGTGLRRVISELANASPAATAALQNYGISLDQVNPLTNKLQDIVQKLADAGLSAADAFTIFGDRGAPAILALTSQTAKLSDLSQAMKESEGRAQEMADVMADNLSGDLKILQSSVEELVLSLNEKFGLTESLRSATQAATDFVRALSSDDLPSSVSGIVSEINKLDEAIEGSGKGAASRQKAKERKSLLEQRLEQILGETSREKITAELQQVEEEIAALEEKIANPKTTGVTKGRRKVEYDLSPEEIKANTNLLREQLEERQQTLQSFQARADSFLEAALEKEVELSKAAAEKKAELEKAQKQAEESARTQNLDRVRKSLLTEEELIQQSYEARKQIVLDNTEASSEARRDLLAALESESTAELEALRESELAKFDIVAESLMTEEEKIRASYKNRRELILADTRTTELEKQKLLDRLEKQTEQQSKQAQIARWSDSVAAFDDFQQNLLVLAKTGNREMSAIYKAGAIANTTIKTYESATSAYAALAGIPIVGPALGIAAASAAIAAGLANVQAIASTNAGSFAYGGNIPAGQVGLVGEAGPELVQGPVRVSSNLDTRNSLGGSNKSTVINFIGIDRSEVESVEEEETKEQRIINIAVNRSVRRAKSELSQEFRTGSGQVAKSVENSYNLRRAAR
jgi:TP901 family phage tail tape measure protein